MVAEDLTETLLISAYDIEHDHMPDTSTLFTGFRGSLYSNPLLLFIDSGGYEVDPTFDGDETWREERQPKEWSEKLYIALLEKLSSEVQAAVVSPDTYAPLTEQISHARDFFARFYQRECRFLSDILLKPSTTGDFIDLSEYTDANLKSLNRFDIIGVTEKELGDDFESRLLNLARLRRTLDRANVNRPIHLFGSLDPLFSPFYFLAGAEIFDGLTWLRYAYVNGLSVYMDSHALLTNKTFHGQARRGAGTHRSNLEELQELKREMRNFAQAPAVEAFRYHRDILAAAWTTLKTNMEDS
ncbi:hypothetical protein [Actinomycetospora flava]|uniref:Uncharacterized protein n=1 Tax=Actinomycetospora flava TaxID=3129232 RepID=A0ABU8M309_9PSEU